MSKTNNKELEESIKRIKILMQDDCDCEECIKNKKAYKSILNYIENSISKEIIKEKKELHIDYLLNQALTSNPTLDAHFRDKEKYIINVLDELLEGK